LKLVDFVWLATDALDKHSFDVVWKRIPILVEVRFETHVADEFCVACIEDVEKFVGGGFVELAFDSEREMEFLRGTY
jgi:hypothetical protein